MKYKDITTTKYHIIQHIINSYAENHEGTKPIISYDARSKILDIGGISKPINFNTSSIGAVPQGAYEVVAQAIRSKDDTGNIAADGMTIYDEATRIYNIVDNDRQQVFDFIDNNVQSSYCACCGTARDRSKLFYIRNINDRNMYQVGSRCITSHFDTSYFDLLKDISEAIDSDDVTLQRKLKDYNLIDYITLYNVLSETSTTAAQCNKNVIELIGSLPTTTNTELLTKYNQQKSIIVKNISEISDFYTAYPSYMREDNMLAIHTIQSMSKLVNSNLDADPYYSKTHCMQAVKQYKDILAAYTSDLRKYRYDLFKYNSHLSQNSLIQIWRANAQADYQIIFSLNKHVLSGRVNNTDNTAVRALGIDIELSDIGEFINKDKALSDMKHFVSTINQMLGANDHWKATVQELIHWKDKCFNRYDKSPEVFVEHDNISVIFHDYISTPLVITSDKSGQPHTGMEEAKRLIGVLVNDSYLRYELNLAYKKFSTKYLGEPKYAYKQPKEFNMSFNCEYLNNKYRTSAPKADPAFCAFISKKSSNILVEYGNSAPLKFGTTDIGIICGADWDIDLKIRTFINAEADLPLPRRSKPREEKSTKEAAQSRPSKFVKKAFSQFKKISCDTLLSDSRVQIVNNSTGSCGVYAKDAGKIMIQMDNGSVVYADKQGNIFKGKIKIDGYQISQNHSFDTQTLTRSFHALEYLVKLTRDNKPLYMKTTKVSGDKLHFIYSYPLTCGSCEGVLKFRITKSSDTYSIDQAPRFIFSTTLKSVPIQGALSLNFSADCWDHVYAGNLEATDIKKSHSDSFGTIWKASNREGEPIYKDTFSLITELS